MFFTTMGMFQNPQHAKTLVLMKFPLETTISPISFSKRGMRSTLPRLSLIIKQPFSFFPFYFWARASEQASVSKHCPLLRGRKGSRGK